jgi:hypothetical protein
MEVEAMGDEQKTQKSAINGRRNSRRKARRRSSETPTAQERLQKKPQSPQEPQPSQEELTTERFIRAIEQLGAKSEQKRRGPSVTLWVSLIFTCVTTAVAAMTFYSTLNPWGEVGPFFTPAGFVIIRGVDTSPSDHVLMPVQWINNTGRLVLIQQPVLEFRKLGQQGEPTGERLTFIAVKRLPEISTETMNGLSTPATEFPDLIRLSAHSPTETVLLFRKEESFLGKQNACFRFHQGASYRVDITYQRYPDPPGIHIGDNIAEQRVTRTLVEQLTIPHTANFLTPLGRGGTGWDYISLQPGSIALQDAIPEDSTKHYQELGYCDR